MFNEAALNQRAALMEERQLRYSVALQLVDQLKFEHSPHENYIDYIEDVLKTAEKILDFVDVVLKGQDATEKKADDDDVGPAPGYL